MPSTKKNRHRKLTLYGISGVLVIILLILTGVIGYRYFSHQKKEKNIVSNVENKANISIGKVHQTATRNGITEWRLDAASMNYFAEDRQSLFQDLSVTFYLNDRSEIYLTANKGVLKTDSKNMTVSGNVVVENENYQLKTKELYYNHNKRMITTQDPVYITGGSIDLAADSMSLDLNTKLTVFKGNVKGILSEKIEL